MPAATLPAALVAEHKAASAALRNSALVDERQAAEMIGITAGTLCVWRSTRRYNLPYIKCGRAVRYRVSDIETFLESRTVNPIVTEAE